MHKIYENWKAEKFMPIFFRSIFFYSNATNNLILSFVVEFLNGCTFFGAEQG